MAEWKAKRFWTEETIVEVEGGFEIQLDGRVLKTPAKTSLTVPTRALADLIKGEWATQEGEIDPLSMPFTRLANAAVDKVAVQFDEVAEIVAAYGGTDLLCYRATYPEGLIARQAEKWDPLLDWAKTRFGVALATGQGVMHVAQNPDETAKLTARVKSETAFGLAALHELVAMSGSLILGLAAAEGQNSVAAIWDLSRVDETWQIQEWGEDEDAAKMVEIKRIEFETIARFYHSLQVA
ncbi:MAG: ATP12 family chaperone protein [Halocynthiibacter sp.]